MITGGISHEKRLVAWGVKNKLAEWLGGGVLVISMMIFADGRATGLLHKDASSEQDDADLYRYE